MNYTQAYIDSQYHIEDWVPLNRKPYDQRYGVSNLGRIRIRANHRIIRSRNDEGLRVASLKIPKAHDHTICSVAHSVLSSFVPRHHDAHLNAQHINDDYTDNRLCNLCWNGDLSRHLHRPVRYHRLLSSRIRGIRLSRHQKNREFMSQIAAAHWLKSRLNIPTSIRSISSYIDASCKHHHSCYGYTVQALSAYRQHALLLKYLRNQLTERYGRAFTQEYQLIDIKKQSVRNLCLIFCHIPCGHTFSVKYTLALEFPPRCYHCYPINPHDPILILKDGVSKVLPSYISAVRYFKRQLPSLTNKRINTGVDNCTCHRQKSFHGYQIYSIR